MTDSAKVILFFTAVLTAVALGIRLVICRRYECTYEEDPDE